MCSSDLERGDKVFGERSRLTTGFLSNRDADNYFPNDDIDNLFGDMATHVMNGSSSNAPYVKFYRLFEIMLQTNTFRNMEQQDRRGDSTLAVSLS